MVCEVLFEFVPHRCISLSLSLCLVVSCPLSSFVSKRLVRDSPTVERGIYELLNQWWNPHKLSNPVSLDEAGQLSGYITS